MRRMSGVWRSWKMIFWKPPGGPFQFIGATSVSTGMPGQYEHFETPLGVYDHVLDNPDFRSEGTLNEFGIRGYGAQGRRIFDFGWVTAPRGWGNHALAAAVVVVDLHRRKSSFDE